MRPSRPIRCVLRALASPFSVPRFVVPFPTRPRLLACACDEVWACSRSRRGTLCMIRLPFNMPVWAYTDSGCYVSCVSDPFACVLCVDGDSRDFRAHIGDRQGEAGSEYRFSLRLHARGVVIAVLVLLRPLHPMSITPQTPWRYMWRVHNIESERLGARDKWCTSRGAFLWSQE